MCEHYTEDSEKPENRKALGENCETCQELDCAHNKNEEEPPGYHSNLCEDAKKYLGKKEE